MSARRERVLAWAPFVVLIVLAIIYIAPFLLQVVNSFRPDADVVREPLSLGIGIVDRGGLRAVVHPQ